MHFLVWLLIFFKDGIRPFGFLKMLCPRNRLDPRLDRINMVPVIIISKDDKHRDFAKIHTV